MARSWTAGGSGWSRREETGRGQDPGQDPDQGREEPDQGRGPGPGSANLGLIKLKNNKRANAMMTYLQNRILQVMSSGHVTGAVPRGTGENTLKVNINHFATI